MDHFIEPSYANNDKLVARDIYHFSSPNGNRQCTKYLKKELKKTEMNICFYSLYKFIYNE